MGRAAASRQAGGARADHGPWSLQAGVATPRRGRFSRHQGVCDGGNFTETRSPLLTGKNTQLQVTFGVMG